MQKVLISTAALVLAVSSVSVYGQVVVNENFDDGNGATRWDFVGREAGLDPTLAGNVPDAAVNFNFNYLAAPITQGQPALIPAAPHGGGGIGVKIATNDNLGSLAATNAIAAAAILSKTS